MKCIPLFTLLASIAITPVVCGQNSDAAVKEVPRNGVVNRARANPQRHQRGNVQNLARQRNANPGVVQSARGNVGQSAFRSAVGRRRAIQPTSSAVQPSYTPDGNINRARYGNRDGSRPSRNFNRGNRASEFNATTGNFRENQNRQGNARRNRGGGDRQSVSAYRGGRHGDWDRSRRNRSWWRSHYSRFALFGGGYYYWNAGYWYPAYGYDPYFSSYVYDAPIYGYNDLEPGEVIARVQAELQRLGYDPGSVDGDFGPATREALVAYQQDNGLQATGEIDQDTLGALGLE
ncbi:MAG: peptidoglycan-binding domain-containing protein [Chthoniobacterales bacterium]